MELITQRGFNRDRDLTTALSALIKRGEPTSEAPPLTAEVGGGVGGFIA